MMQQRRLSLRFLFRAMLASILVTGMLLAGWPAQAAAAPALQAQPALPLAPMFATYADQQGIAAFTGPAITPLLYEQQTTILVQYTTTHRFELRDGAVHLAALGRELTHHRQDEPPFQWQDPAGLDLSETAIFIDESGHSIDEPFRSFWEQHGQVATFGWPISEAFIEHEAIEGSPVLVQYFERGRLVAAVPAVADEPEPTPEPAMEFGDEEGGNAEQEPGEGDDAEPAPTPEPDENDADRRDDGSIESGTGSTGLGARLSVDDAGGAPVGISVAHLGAQHLALVRGFDERAFLELPTPGGSSGDVTPLASATWFYNPSSNDGRNMARAMNLLDGTIVERGHRLSILATIGPLTQANGYLPGSAIEDGQIVRNSVAGGVCAVSTILYRAAWMAGLPIHSRRGHSLFLDNFHDGGWLGIEAAIYGDSLDLVIGNNTPGPMLVRASVEPARHVLTLTLYGLPDGRVVKRMEPLPSKALSDILRERGLLSAGGAGTEVSVTNERLIIYPDGRTQTDRVKSYYRMP